MWGQLLASVRPDPRCVIESPVLLLRGVGDTLGNIARRMDEWHRRDPDCRYVVIPDAGHLANMDNPEAVNSELGSFLKRVF